MSKDDNAKGQHLGYLYQYERALIMLGKLVSKDHYIAIEKVDDLSAHDEQHTTLISEQDKHSIAYSNKQAFANGSYDLWRTLELWITKLKEGKITQSTELKCVSNKSISEDNLLNKVISAKTDQRAESIIQTFLSEKEAYLKRRQQEGKSTEAVIKMIKKIKFVIEEKDSLFLIRKNITIEQDQTTENIKVDLLNFLMKEDNDGSNVFIETLTGWLIGKCKSQWQSGKEAYIKRAEFNEKVESLNQSQSFKNLMLTAKEQYDQEISDSEREMKKDNLFVRQVSCINRRNKQQFILEAISDFLCYEREEARIIKKGNILEHDFESFHKNNKERWSREFNSLVKREEYSEEEANDIAISVYDTVMRLNVKFLDIYEMNVSNDYVKRGSFHKLADSLSIGWHPNWEKMFTE